MMTTVNYGLIAIAIAIAFAAALWAGLPVSTLAILGVVLMCPLMMLLMMRGAHGGRDDERDTTHRRTPGHGSSGRPS